MVVAESFLKSTAPTDVNRRCEALVFIGCTECNPNGDPEDGNKPRQDPETGHGRISNVCLKRHLRDTAAILAEDRPGFGIYVTRQSILERKLRAAYEAEGIKIKNGGGAGATKKEDAASSSEAKEEGEESAPAPRSKEDAENEARVKMRLCKDYLDVRWFGGVVNPKAIDGQVRGPFMVSWARSLDPVTVLDESITRVAIQTEREAKTNFRNQMFGRRPQVLYGLYAAEVYYSPSFARATGITPDDLKLFWESLARMFEYTRSASRDRIAVEQVVVFEHDSPLGRAPAHRLFRTVMGIDKEGKRIVRLRNETAPPRDFSDYVFPTLEETQARVDELGYKGVRVHYLL
jgi:CRISPR-associated protein Csd2